MQYGVDKGGPATLVNDDNDEHGSNDGNQTARASIEVYIRWWKSIGVVA